MITRHPLTAVLLDLNNFEQINDTHSHPAGDVVLQKFAGCLQGAIRNGYLVVRMGDDEFLVVPPECNFRTITSCP
jgi:two-component system, cell cycle response regulator